MAVLAVEELTRTGLQFAAPAAAAGGDQFLPSDRTFVRIANAGGGSITVTIVSTSTLLGLAVADVVVVVGAGAQIHIGPFPAEHFADPTDGLADMTYTGVTSVTVSAVRLSRP